MSELHLQPSSVQLTWAGRLDPPLLIALLSHTYLPRSLVAYSILYTSNIYSPIGLNLKKKSTYD